MKMKKTHLYYEKEGYFGYIEIRMFYSEKFTIEDDLLGKVDNIFRSWMNNNYQRWEKKLWRSVSINNFTLVFVILT